MTSLGQVFGASSDLYTRTHERKYTVIYINLTERVLCYYVLLTMHFGTFLVNNQLETQLFFLYIYFNSICMFRAVMCSSSGQSIVSIRHLLYVIGDRLLCRLGVPSKPAYQMVTYIEWHISNVVLIQLTVLMMST